MKFSTTVFAFLGLLSSVRADEAAFRALEKQSNLLQLQALNASQTGCTSANVAVRREWSTLPTKEKHSYINAVKCLRRLPPLNLPSLVPGVRSRFDDYQAVHINSTFIIHFNGRFLPWHRYFVSVYEQALRSQCNYTGYQPYWEWSTFANDPVASPLFDGSNTSISGNGAKVPHDDFSYTIPYSGGLHNTCPAQDGGGCLTTGPFANLTVNLGPVNSNASLPGWVGSGTGLDYNPRCLTRDMGSYWSNYTGWDNVTTLLEADDFATFATLLTQGVHRGGHFTIGGLNNDLFTSPGDPAFFFHHAQIDRIWTLWQNLNLTKRGTEIAGTSTWFNCMHS
ncbi:MAG: hypothetical protein HETSPECPRED_010536 [Heterodermia speciosa]|uniref:Tyrosinase copper-binding domain-containing protein n=1 Tax=Heterodermia speciosa TaxID=116794 RepID=A0A8H3G6G5_9LECA|nr:MAG: hypothetical protein HETSPECPRED_010536 [Heterodermia speciosa]